MLNIAIINGPNLNLLGERETSIYGSKPFNEYLTQLKVIHSDVNISHYQSNVEGELINFLQECRNTTDGIIFNGAGYTHTSVAIADAIAAIDTPVIEVHISNIHAREEFRKTSLTAGNCIGSIAGLGLNGYSLAISHFKMLIRA